MSPENTTGTEENNRDTFLSTVEADLVSHANFWQSDLEKATKEGEGLEDVAQQWRVETGKTVEKILAEKRTIDKSRMPASIVISGTGEDWAYFLKRYFGKRLSRRIPALTNVRGYDPSTVLSLAKKIGVVPRKIPDTFIFKRNFNENYLDGADIEAAYNIIPVHSPLLPPNSFWHEAFSGTDYSAYTDVLITLNRRFIPTDTTIPSLNRMILKIQGI